MAFVMFCFGVPFMFSLTDNRIDGKLTLLCIIYTLCLYDLLEIR